MPGFIQTAPIAESFFWVLLMDFESLLRERLRKLIEKHRSLQDQQHAIQGAIAEVRSLIQKIEQDGAN